MVLYYLQYSVGTPPNFVPQFPIAGDHIRPQLANIRPQAIYRLGQIADLGEQAAQMEYDFAGDYRQRHDDAEADDDGCDERGIGNNGRGSFHDVAAAWLSVCDLPTESATVARPMRKITKASPDC